MSNSARLAAPINPLIKRNWVPTCMLMMHDDDVSTTIRFVPSHVAKDPDARYTVSFKVFGDDPTFPIWEHQGPEIGLTDLYCIDSAQVARETGRKKLFCYMEEYSRIVDRNPNSSIITLNSQAHYYSRSGAVQGQLGGFLIFGSPVKMLKGDYYYDALPAASLEGGKSILVYIINPFTRPSAYSIVLVAADGCKWESPTLNLAGKSGVLWNSSEYETSMLKSPCGLIVKSYLKLSCAFAARDAEGRMVGMDHGHGFLSQVLKH